MSPEITQTGRNLWRELEAICKLPPSPEKDAQLQDWRRRCEAQYVPVRRKPGDFQKLKDE